MNGDNADFAAVARLIQSDAAFAAEVLRLANSALFATRFEVVSILHAISVLGVLRLKAMVLTVGLREFVSMGNGCAVLRRCWRHNLAAALAADAIAGACDIDGSESYTAGLMHGIGHVALIAADADGYLRAAGRAKDQPRRLIEFEQDELGFNHVDAAVILVRHWRLPQIFEQICRCDHHDGVIDPSHPAGTAELACDLATMLGFSTHPRDADWAPDALIERLPGRFHRCMRAQLPDLSEAIPLKLNLLEQEFLSS
jgi:HD-like signal output (HDOD) protein